MPSQCCHWGGSSYTTTEDWGSSLRLTVTGRTMRVRWITTWYSTVPGDISEDVLVENVQHRALGKHHSCHYCNVCCRIQLHTRGPSHRLRPWPPSWSCESNRMVQIPYEHVDAKACCGAIPLCWTWRCDSLLFVLSRYLWIKNLSLCEDMSSSSQIWNQCHFWACSDFLCLSWTCWVPKILCASTSQCVLFQLQAC